MNHRILSTLAVAASTVSGVAAPVEPLSIPPREVRAVGNARDVLLPSGALRRFGEIRFRHPGGINASALSPDGKQLATAAHYSVVLWDTATGNPIRRLDTGRAPHFATQSLAFSPDGKLLVAVVGPTEVFVWETAMGRETRRITCEPKEGNGFNGLAAFVADGAQLALGREQETEFRDVRTWNVARSLPVSARLISPIGSTVISLSKAGAASMIDLSASRPPIDLKVEVRDAGLAFSPDGRLLATFSIFGRLELWSVPDGRKLKSEDVLGDVRSGRIAFASDGQTLFLSTPGGATWWDAANWKAVAAIPRNSELSQPSITGVHALPDGATVLACCDDGMVRRFNRKTAKPLPEPAGYSNSARAVATPDGRYLAIGDQSGRVDWWDRVSGKRIRVICEAGLPITKVAVAPDGKSIAISRLGPGTIELRDTSTGKELAQLQMPGSEKTRRYVRTVGFSPDGHTLFGATWSGRLQLWSARSHAAIWTADSSGQCAFAPDNKTLVCSFDGPLLVFHSSPTWAEAHRVLLPEDPRNDSPNHVTAMVFSADGRRLAVATADQRIRLCDPVTGQQRHSFVGFDEPRAVGINPRVRIYVGADALAFSRDGGWLLSGGPDGIVRLWEVSTRREAHRFLGHERRVTFVSFGPDGKTILSAADDGGVYEWALRPPAAPPVRSVWEDLASSDPAVGYRAIWALLDDPEGAVGTLRKNLTPAVRPKPEELDRLIARLDAPRFADREAAAVQLADLGPLAVPAIRAAMEMRPSAEARARLDRLLAPPDHPPPGELRRLRAVQVMELAGTTGARALLKDWSSGAAGATLTEEAKAAVKRLNVR